VEASSETIIPVMVQRVDYPRLRPDAVSQNLLTAQNDQLYDVPGRSASPYQQRTLVALCPLQAVLDTRTPQFSIPATLRFTNAAPTVTSLELDAGDGQGYRSVGKGQTLGASYAANGHYTLRFRLTCADGTVLLSQARSDAAELGLKKRRNTGLPSGYKRCTFTES
jgi:hypothetical protein